MYKFFKFCFLTAMMSIALFSCEKGISLVSIETTPPWKKIYTVGEEFDPAGMEIIAKFSDGSENEINVDEVMYMYDFWTAGTNISVTIAYAYKGKTATAEITDITVVANITVTVAGKYTYNGEEIKPSGESVTVSDGSATLTEGTDYTLSYSNNRNAGEATVIATGTGAYTGSTGAVNFTIARFPIIVEAHPVSKYFRDLDPLLTYTTYPELFGSDVLSGKLIRETGTTAGTYYIDRGNLAETGNYEITNYYGAVFTIHYFVGSGTSDKPFEIDSPEQLAMLAELIN